MGKTKIAITLDDDSLGELARLVKQGFFQNRSHAIQQAISEKLVKLKKTRLISESMKLNQMDERAMAEEGIEAYTQCGLNVKR